MKNLSELSLVLLLTSVIAVACVPKAKASNDAHIQLQLVSNGCVERTYPDAFDRYVQPEILATEANEST